MWRFRMPVGLLSDQEQFDSAWMDESKFIQKFEHKNRIREIF